VLVAGAGFFAFAPQLNLPSFDAAAGPYNIVGRIGQREGIWSLAVQLVREHPLIGIGPGAFEAYSAANVRQVEPGVYEVPVPHAHNWLLQVALDAGLVGLLGFVVLLLLSARSLWRAWRSETLRPFVVALSGAWAAMLVHGVTDATMIDTRASLVFWWIFGLSLVWDYGAS
jgi:O-antigen ligase